MRWLVLAASGLAAIVACGDDSKVECRVGADCASGICTTDGTCAAAATSSSSGGPTTDASSNGNSDSDSGTMLSGDGSVAQGCVPNKDGVITREEVPLKAGLKATFRVATDVDVSTAGTTRNDGSREWDYSGAFTGDQNVTVETLSLNGTWYAPKYNGAAYSSKLRSDSNLFGVFDLAPATIALRGVVTPDDDGVYRTELKYDPTVAVVTFPLKADATWTSESDVSGVASGVPVAYTEKYESQVDAHGDLKTPFATFPVLRVRTVLTRTVGFAVTTVRTFAFVTECYGTVATVTSDDNEGDVEFTHALEIRRIAP